MGLQFKYVIGLDIGIASVGWCVMKCDNSGNPTRIADLGSRVFSPAEASDGSSLSAQRRIARGTRRSLRRKADRLDGIKGLFADNGVLISFHTNDGTCLEDVNVLRVKALDGVISENDFARVLYSIAKHRGFKSNRKSEESDKDAGKLIGAAKQNASKMEQMGYRTIGELLLAEHSRVLQDAKGNNYLRLSVRNKGGEYTKTVYRSNLIDEINILFEKQKEFGNKLANDIVKSKYIELFSSQRNYDEGPAKSSPYSAEYKIGKCTFEDEQRAPKDSYTFALFTALCNLNNVSLIKDGETRTLSNDERNTIIESFSKKKKVSYYDVRRLLKLSDEERFNISYPKYDIKFTDDKYKEACAKAEKGKLVSNMENSSAIAKALSPQNALDTELIDEISCVLSTAKSDDKRKVRFAENTYCSERLTDEEIENLLVLNCDKFGMLGFTAMRKIIPYLERGMKYVNACEAAGYKQSAVIGEKSILLNGEAVYSEISEITSPVVRRSVSQTLKVVNAIIRQYGSPVAINIELGREISKSRKERDFIEKMNKTNFEENERRKQEFISKFGVSPKGNDMLKYRLYEEQNCRSPYSGDVIDINRLFNDNYYQIDHVMPFSRCFNDSLMNKVLVPTAENQKKGNRLPYEWLDEKAFEEYRERVSVIYSNNKDKLNVLLKKKIDETEWKSRALNDTRYISRFVMNLFQEHLVFDTSILNKKRVFAYNGRMTDFLRKRWGIKKIREDGDFHHAVDAAVLACMTGGITQKISEFCKNEEIRYLDNEIYDVVSGENIETSYKFVSRLPLPYEQFRDELKCRCAMNLDIMRERLKNMGYSDEELAMVKLPIASRMPKRKMTGQIHDATIRSAKYYDEEGIVVSKVPLTKLKLTDDHKAIDGYFRKEDDLPLYRHLLTLLQQADGNAQEAFKDPVYKPRADGNNGNLVRKVKIQEKSTLGVRLDKVKGYAKNGGMVRIDVFVKEGKRYCVPVYVADLYKGVLPNKAVTSGKKYSEWPEMDDTYEFLFSLYPNDLIYLENPKGITFKKRKRNVNSAMPDELCFTEGMAYYLGFDINTERANCEDVLGCYEMRLATKTAPVIKKCVIDVLGNVTFVKEEKRQPLNRK